MKKIKYLFVFMFMILLAKKSSAQQDPQFTQYIDNAVYANPAIAGSRGVLSITAIGRFQWVGFKGAPMSQSLSLNTPLKYKSIGLGFSIVNDIIGPMTQTWFNADFSYSLRFKKSKRNARLSFGLKAGVNLLNVRLTELAKPDLDDDLLSANVSNRITPNVGFGIYFRNDFFYIGVSTPKIISYGKNQMIKTNSIQELRHYFILAGGLFSIGNNWQMKPSTQIKLVEGAPASVDITAMFIYNERIYLAANYRVLSSIGAIAQFRITPQFKIGYAFDISTSRLFRQNFGSHEILLRYDFLFDRKKMKSPRYF